MCPATENQQIVDFFNSDYRWWDDVYEDSLPRGFLSFEMIKRRALMVEILNRYAAATGPLNILECGCGPGGIISKLDMKSFRLTAIDINRRHLLKGRQDIGPTVFWLQADAEMLPFRDQSFDLVYCVGVLSYLQEDERAIAEISRVVRPGGAVIIALPSLFILNKLLDPYYFLVWLPARLAGRLAPTAKQTGASKFAAAKIRRYRFTPFSKLCLRYGLLEVERANVSFGPLTFWRREFLPLRVSMQLSEALLALGRRKGFSFLRGITNHWIACLEKTCS